MTHIARLSAAALMVLSSGVLGACAALSGHRAATWTLSPAIADSVRTESIAKGVRLHHLVRTATPLRAHVLDIDLKACVSVRAVKGAPTALGRTTTSDLLRAPPDVDVPLAAVNADFFTIAAGGPQGLPVGAMVENGRLLSGPITRPVFWLSGAGHPSIGTLSVRGAVVTLRGRVPVSSWNRPSANAVGLVDAAWGLPLDSTSRVGAMLLVPQGGSQYRISVLPASHPGVARADTMLLVGIARASLLEGDVVRVELSLAPAMPWQAVGGYPLLLADSVIVPNVDTDGAASFRGVNPRTAAGFADKGRRLLLVVIDGRQAGYSAGTTTRETAELLRALGAREAVNLDGGGSTAMVVRDVATGQVRVVNKPSDPTGERPVGNALVVTGTCSRR